MKKKKVFITKVVLRSVLEIVQELIGNFVLVNENSLEKVAFSLLVFSNRSYNSNGLFIYQKNSIKKEEAKRDKIVFRFSKFSCVYYIIKLCRQ